MKETKNKFPGQLHLEPYKGSEKSGVNAFEIGGDYIIVAFKDGRIYLYNHEFPGEEPVEIMKERARDGKGLSSYINRDIRQYYVAQWDKNSKMFKPNKKILA
jgi:hypothetical protein